MSWAFRSNDTYDALELRGGVLAAAARCVRCAATTIFRFDDKEESQGKEGGERFADRTEFRFRNEMTDTLRWT